MSEAIRLLHALAQALSTAALYSPGHPATRRSLESLFQSLVVLLHADAHPIFFFLGSAPVYSGRALHELSEWPWSRRLADVGVQRLEFDGAITQESVAAMIERLMVRLTTGATDAPEEPIPGVVFGNVTVQEEVVEETGEVMLVEAGGREMQLDLTDELEAMAFVRSEAVRGVVARAEAEAVARILGGLFDAHDLPQAAHGDHARYPLVHAVNTALLAMAAASAWVDRAGRQRLGVVALLHDIGMARIPAELGSKETLSSEERAIVETHTTRGAKLLLEGGGRGLELAATIAFEHHLRPDQSGYPARRFRPAPHWASRLVGVAAAYAALRAPRPFRPAWSIDRAIAYLDSGAGTVFDAEASRMVSAVVRAG